MNRKEELLNELAEIEAREKNKLWVPKLGEGYWIVGGNGETAEYIFANDKYDKNQIAHHNIHKSEELAEAQSKRISAFNELNRIADEFGRGRVEIYWGTEGEFCRATGAEFLTSLNIFTVESAKITIEIMSDNCKAFIKGELD